MLRNRYGPFIHDDTKLGIDCARMFAGALCVGIAQAALNEAIKYAKERVQFKKPLSQFQGLQFIMADMASEIEAVRLLVYKAAWVRVNIAES